MPLDPALQAEAQSWLLKAGEDLEAAETLLKRDPPLCGVASFHTQQAAEKSLKSFLAFNDQRIRKTHSLVELGEECVRLDQSLAVICKLVAPISGSSGGVSLSRRLGYSHGRRSGGSPSNCADPVRFHSGAAPKSSLPVRSWIARRHFLTSATSAGFVVIARSSRFRLMT